MTCLVKYRPSKNLKTLDQNFELFKAYKTTVFIFKTF